MKNEANINEVNQSTEADFKDLHVDSKPPRKFLRPIGQEPQSASKLPKREAQPLVIKIENKEKGSSVSMPSIVKKEKKKKVNVAADVKIKIIDTESNTPQNYPLSPTNSLKIHDINSRKILKSTDENTLLHSEQLKVNNNETKLNNNFASISNENIGLREETDMLLNVGLPITEIIELNQSKQSALSFENEDSIEKYAAVVEIDISDGQEAEESKSFNDYSLIPKTKNHQKHQTDEKNLTYDKNKLMLEYLYGVHGAPIRVRSGHYRLPLSEDNSALKKHEEKRSTNEDFPQYINKSINNSKYFTKLLFDYNAKQENLKDRMERCKENQDRIISEKMNRFMDSINKKLTTTQHSSYAGKQRRQLCFSASASNSEARKTSIPLTLPYTAPNNLSSSAVLAKVQLQPTYFVSQIEMEDILNEVNVRVDLVNRKTKWPILALDLGEKQFDLDDKDGKLHPLNKTENKRKKKISEEQLRNDPTFHR